MKTKIGYGGAQREMQPTKINQIVGFLVPHEQIIELRDENHMVLQ